MIGSTATRQGEASRVDRIYNSPAGTAVYEGNVAGGAGRQIFVSNPGMSGVTPVGNAVPLPQYGS